MKYMTQVLGSILGLAVLTNISTCSALPTTSLADWLGGIKAIRPKHGETLLIGEFADQAALRGFMDQLWNLNFTIVYLKRIEHEQPK